MSRIVVFGANGFIGQHLVRALVEQDSNHEIIAFDRFSEYTTGEDYPFSDAPSVKIVAGNFLNRDDLSSVLDGAEYVFHLISLTTPATSNKDPFIDIDTNVRGTVELLELCAEKGIKKVVFPSSGGTVYGDHLEEQLSERMIPMPRSPYGIGKLTIEHYLRYFKYTHGLEYIVYRIANPYGPGQNIFGKQGVIPIFLHKFLLREPVTIYGDGSMVRDYIYIDDLIRMIVGSYVQSSAHTEYNLGSGSGESINDILESVEACTGYRAERDHVEVPSTFVKKSILDISRFEEEFGTQSFTSLDEGMRKTWDYVQRLG